MIYHLVRVLNVGVKQLIRRAVEILGQRREKQRKGDSPEISCLQGNSEIKINAYVTFKDILRAAGKVEDA
jgi:hypothetical protein